MSKFIQVLAIALVSVAFAAPTDKLVSVLNNESKGYHSVKIIAGLGFPEILTRVDSVTLKGGILTFVQKKSDKGEKNEFQRCFSTLPVMITTVKSAKDGTKGMTVTTAAELSKEAAAPCSQALEGAAKTFIASANQITLAVGGAMVFAKEGFSLEFADGVIIAKGKTPAGDEVAVYAIGTLSSVASAINDKGVNNVSLVGSLSLPPVVKKGGLF